MFFPSIFVLTLQLLCLNNCPCNFEDHSNSDCSTIPKIIKKAGGEAKFLDAKFLDCSCGPIHQLRRIAVSIMISQAGNAIPLGCKSSAEYMYPQLDHKISIVHSSLTMDDVSANFQNDLRTDLREQDSSPSQNSECQANMKQQMYIKGRKESISSLHSIPNIQHSMNVKASSKFLKMDSLKSLQTVMNTQIYNKHTRISGSEDRSQDNSSIGGHGLYNQNIANLENNDMGGSLNLLVDAIQLLECRELPRTIGLQIQENVSVQILPKKLRRMKIAMGKPSLQIPQCLVEDHCLESAKQLAFSKVSQSGDGQHSFNSISRVGEREEGTMSRTRSKRGRLQAFPSKYSDSVLQPWKKVSRKVPSCECS